MKKLFAVISGAGLLLSVGLSNAPAARADSACTNATLTDGFGIQTTGTLLEGAPGPAGPFAANHWSQVKVAKHLSRVRLG